LNADMKGQELQTKPKPPAADWPWWKLTGLVFLTLAGFAVGFILVPFPSSIALWIAVALIFLTAVVVVWSMRSEPWWAQVAYMNAWMLLILGISLRNWAAVIPISPIWVVPIVGIYAIAWALPIFRPEFSLKLAREQVNPKTIAGRVFVTVALIVSSIAAAIAPSLGLFGPRWGIQNEVHVFIATGSTIVAIVLSQYTSSHLWPQRPWAETEQ